MTDTNTAQLVVDLKATDDAVRAKGWVSPGLGVPGASLGLLGSTFNPLSALATAGLGWFMPFVSFLGEGLTQLQGGSAGSVASGAQSFGDAGRDITGVADAYRESTSAQTSGWSGAAASEYRDAAARHADGIAGLGQASTTTGSAIIGAGQVVAQAIAEVTELIAEAVAQIVPIMSQAVARAPETFGQSIAEAIPPCVGIAIEYALRIAAKLAALVASGQNLLKLVQGAMAVVDLIKQALSSISQQSIRPDAEPTPGTGADQRQDGGSASTAGAAGSGTPMGAEDPGTTGSSAPMSPAGGFGGGAPTPGGSAAPGAAPLGVGAQSTGAVPPVPPVPPSHGTVPEASRYPGHPGGAGAPTGPGPNAGVPIGAAGLGPATGAVRGGADVARQPGRQQPARTSATAGGAPAGVPLGAMGAARAAGDPDTEHQRKYSVVAEHDEPLEVAPPVISSSTTKD
ncbi:MAG TPA: hypothetical protein VGX25_24800 [Actinophytocola sp.]|uniref:WXG100 family type VII secretion target n=1 Tax=Actinophytocola sp. TaxID=1872138 RepID=UPI002DDD28E4|nr:hypothetical protein [Actinophytocola sp.]HEV2782624.1 hypothetical protein [Actinophytocola sp.]